MNYNIYIKILHGDLLHVLFVSSYTVCVEINLMSEQLGTTPDTQDSLVFLFQSMLKC